MVSLKHILAALALSTAFVTAPSILDAKAPTHTTTKHVAAKKHPKKVHRKHSAKSTHKKTAAKSKKHVIPTTTHGKKPAASKSTATGWRHHQVV